MSRRKLYGIVGSIGALAAVTALALTLVFSQGGASPAGSSPGPAASAVTLAQPSGEAATSGGPAKDVVAVAPAPDISLAAAAAPAAYGGGPAEGIKVHGQWTIEVRDPDGTLVSHTEFDNALSGDGPAVLRSVLSRTNSFGFWQISLGSTTSTQPCAPLFCIIGEPNDTNTVIASRTLSVSAEGNTVVLKGQATATATTSIGRVATVAGLCQPNVAPSSPCSSSTATFGFTLKDLASPQNVSSGQIVQVTVVISFS